MLTGRKEIPLHWLDRREMRSGRAGVTWGVPWPQGSLDRKMPLGLTLGDGTASPLQSWPAAYWPDGSVKWTAHAAVLPLECMGATIVADEASAAAPVQADDGDASGSDQERDVGEARVDATGDREASAAARAVTVLVRETEDEIEVNTGAISCRVGRTGSDIIRELTSAGSGCVVVGKLVALRERVSLTSGLTGRMEETFESEIKSATTEQRGPIRAVVKLEGIHRQTSGTTGTEWLPFTLRLYFYAGLAEVGVTHTFLYDGDPHSDAIKGIGMRLAAALDGPLYNRHVRLAGDTGWFGDSPKGLMTFRLTEHIVPRYREQLAGKPVAFDTADDRDAVFLRLLQDSAVWGDFKLTQLSPDSYNIRKRTGEGCSWVRALGGQRARGVVYAGSGQGGIGVGVRHFWRQAPAGLEVRGMAGAEASITAWFWSPDAEAMDLRHYDKTTHVASSYEGADELRSTPYGVAHTTQCVIWCCEGTPGADELDRWADSLESPPLLVCEPSHYYGTRAFGAWSLPDRSTPAKARLENMLDGIAEFYMREIEARGWYGFWDYGDVMHSYDPVRHTWRYDIGGCAWQNTELVPNIWLWYMFLRSGRADLFRMAEAMTRHTSETDLYHIGEYAGLGSRHNVMHWGCGCKEARIGMAGLHKFYFFLTADERVGDILDEVKDADYATAGLDPMRAYFPKDEYATHARSGPDWSAFCSNWLLQWERYGDKRYRDKMLAGIKSLKSAPHQLLTGPTFGYDPGTGILSHMGHENYGHHLMICMGGTQVWMEMAALLDDPEWSDMLAEYGEFYNLPPEEKSRRTNGDIVGKDWSIPMLSTSMMAFAAVHRGNGALAKEAWGYLLEGKTNWNINEPLRPVAVPTSEYAYPIEEIAWMSTNTASQWSINVIVCLELIGDALDQE